MWSAIRRLLECLRTGTWSTGDSMGKRSIRENKNIYQMSREEAGFTREKASEAMGCISDDRIEKIESEKSLPHPDEILLMSDCYKKPELCNYFCSHECPIGQIYVPEVRSLDLPQIALEVLAHLNALEKVRDRFIEITVDGQVSEDQKADFMKIREKLEQISRTVDSLQLWIRQRAMDDPPA